MGWKATRTIDVRNPFISVAENPRTQFNRLRSQALARIEEAAAQDRPLTALEKVNNDLAYRRMLDLKKEIDGR